MKTKKTKQTNKTEFFQFGFYNYIYRKRILLFLYKCIRDELTIKELINCYNFYRERLI